MLSRTCHRSIASAGGAARRDATRGHVPGGPLGTSGRDSRSETSDVSPVHVRLLDGTLASESADSESDSWPSRWRPPIDAWSSHAVCVGGRLFRCAHVAALEERDGGGRDEGRWFDE